LDNLTHSLVGLALAYAGAGRRTPYAAATLVLASNAPDIDVVSALQGGSLSYLAAHRGVTHGPVGFVVLGIATATLVTGWAAYRERRRGSSRTAWQGWLPLALLATLAVALHALMDLPTTYGIRILSPLDRTWYALDWMPIIDIYLWAALVGALGAGRLFPRARRALACAVLVVVAADYGLRGGLHQIALRQASAESAAGAPGACAAAPTLVRHPAVIEATLAGPEACIQAAALPTFLSPFTWRAVRQFPNGYELSDRRLFDRGAPGPAVWIPSESNAAVARARSTATGRVFLDFARFPASRVVEQRPDAVTVRIVDVRFVGTPLTLEPNPQARAPFVITVEVNREGGVLLERIGD
jgi:inner membrane protein